MPLDAARAALGLPSRDLVAALARGTVILDGGYLRGPAAPATTAQPDAKPQATSKAQALPPAVARAVQAVLDDLAKEPFAAPDTARLRELGLDSKAVAAAARGGLLLRVADMIVLAPGADKEAARLLGQLPQPFTTSQARQALRTSRRVVIPLLEYLDRARVTERLPGDLRRLRPQP
jgi:selenocysteine-specific elongation factor